MSRSTSTPHPTVIQAGVRLRKARLGRGFSQAKVARIVGCSSKTIANIEAGRGVPRAPLAIRLAEAVWIPLDYIWREVPVGAQLVSPPDQETRRQQLLARARRRPRLLALRVQRARELLAGEPNSPSASS